MKKFKLFIVIIALSLNVYSQNSRSILANIGTTVFSGIMDKSAEMGINCAVSINKIHLDLSSNAGNDKSSLNLGVVNLGYIIAIIPSICSIIPVVGLGMSNGNYKGMYSCDLFHSENQTYYYNLGFIGTIRLGDNLGLYTGIGTFESFRLGVIFGRF
jgi:hypothetical protein